ncbi:MAG: type II toxin-antitoxin system RelE/ParE family toxin [Caulobacteraceae bacterium]
MPDPNWTIVLGGEAERDFSHIVDWTTENFGPRQAERYANLILAAIDVIAENPLSTRSREREEIGGAYRTVHLARPGRHFILYRMEGADTILIVRILHDSMELSRHAPED